MADASISFGALLLAYDLIFAQKKESRNSLPKRVCHHNRYGCLPDFMYPILFRIWNFPINTYGVFLALAFLGAIFVTVKLGPARRTAA